VARINFLAAAGRGGCGTCVTRVAYFIRATVVVRMTVGFDGASGAPLRPVGRSRRAGRAVTQFFEQRSVIVRYHQRNRSAAESLGSAFADADEVPSRSEAGLVTDTAIVNRGVRAPSHRSRSHGNQPQVNQPSADHSRADHSLRGHSRRHVDLARVASALCCG